MGYALETAAFTLNRAPSKSVETTPYELWFGMKPKLLFLKVWGCDAYVKKFQHDKFQHELLGISSITDPEARYSLLKMDPFWRRSFSQKK